MPRQVRGAFDALDRLCTTDQTAALEKWNTNVENSNWMTYPPLAVLHGVTHFAAVLYSAG
jgi:hypothetical protein